MVNIITTDVFDNWFDGLRDRQAKARIRARLARVQTGNFGDCKYFSGIGEMRVGHGPGYRLYFLRRGDQLVVLLCGGDKGSQDRDIKRAVEIAKEV